MYSGITTAYKEYGNSVILNKRFRHHQVMRTELKPNFSNSQIQPYISDNCINHPRHERY